MAETIEERLRRLATNSAAFREAEAASLGEGRRVLDALAMTDLDDRAKDANEVKRILELPIQRGLSDDEFEAFCQENTQREVYEAFNVRMEWHASDYFRQHPDSQFHDAKLYGEDKARREGHFKYQRIQAEAIVAYTEMDGMFGQIRVGGGKTLILQKIADLALKADHKRVVLVLPRRLIGQFLNYDMAWARARVPIDYPPPHSFGGLDPEDRHLLATSGKRGVYLLPTSILRMPTSADIFEKIKPTLVLIDEAYNLSNPKAAQTKRVKTYRKQFPHVRFVAVSGTTTKKKLEDFAHLSEWTLREQSPVPTNESGLLGAWSGMISAGTVPTSLTTGSLTRLVGWARGQFPGEDFPNEVNGFRKAFTRRMQTARGVVTSGENDLGISVTYCNRPVPDYQDHPTWARCQALIDQVALGIAPNLEQIEHELGKWKWFEELRSGYYNELYWPTLADYVERRKVTEDQGALELHQGQAHHEATQLYNKFLRRFMDDHPDAKGEKGSPIDSPLLVANEMQHHGPKNVTRILYDAWRDKKEKEIPGMAERWEKFVPVCDFKIQHLLKWCQELPEGEGAIVWTHSVGFAEWTVEVLRAAGLQNVIHACAGVRGTELIRDPLNGDKIHIASIDAHHGGLNLQTFHWNMYFHEVPRSAHFMQQAVGRIHRLGQPKDELDIYLNLTTPFDYALFGACLVDACYQHELGLDQTLIYGNFDPLLTCMSVDVLRARGLATAAISAGSKRFLAQKFGMR